MRIQAVPQWQGATWSGAEAALPAGCGVLAGAVADVAGRPVEWVPAARHGSPTVRGVANRAVLVDNRRHQLAALENPEGPVLTLGGDCSADLVPVGVARYRYGEGLGVVWFDAHADCNIAGTSPSGAFHGMVLRSLFGHGDPDFAARPALIPGRAVLVGTRAFDPAERRAVDEGLVAHVPAPAEPGAVVDALRAAGATKLYLHVDVDVLDPGEFGATHYPEPAGLTVDQLAACVDALAEFEVVGAAVTECTATAVDQADALLPAVQALVRRLAA